MMRQLLQITILVCCVFGLTMIGYAAEQNDFRNLHWGMTVGEVKASEASHQLVWDQNELIYRIELAGLQAYITHHFNEEGQLTFSVIDFRSEHVNKDEHIADFYYIKDLLSKKYGRPRTFIDFEWKNACITDAEELAHFIFLGNLSYAQSWRVGQTVIHMTLDDEDNSLMLRLTFAEAGYWDQQLANISIETHPWVQSQAFAVIKEQVIRNAETESVGLLQI